MEKKEIPPPPILKLSNVSYAYHTLAGEISALKQISFQMNQGEFIAIVGPSGCGKSTLLSLIAGLIQPEEGTIDFPTLSKASSDEGAPQKVIGYMLQQDHLFEWLPIYENVTLPLRIAHKNDLALWKQVDYLLEEYGLSSFRQKHPSELSGGMRQRAALIRTLANDPNLLLLDEPFSALDYQTRLKVSSDICHSIRKAGKSAILITHDISEAIHLSDKIYVLSQRPCTILMEIPIHLSQNDDYTYSSSPEYLEYFKMIWEALQNDS